MNNATHGNLIAGCGTHKISRAELARIPTPQGTLTHQPVPHIQLVEALIETLGFRRITVVADEYAVSKDGNRMFGLLELDYEFSGCRFAIGLRNANDKSMRLALTVGYRVFVCSNMAFKGDFTPVLSKHSKNFNLIDCLSVGVDRIQRNFKPLERTIEDWKTCELSDLRAKLVIYEAFVEGKLQVNPKLMKAVHHHYFNPQYEAMATSTLWSLSNAFTSTFKDLKPVQQYQATARLGPFLENYRMSIDV
jgi:Domain of unknown function (DUF932)